MSTVYVCVVQLILCMGTSTYMWGGTGACMSVHECVVQLILCMGTSTYMWGGTGV